MEWKISPGLVEYPDALAVMAARVAAIQRGEAEELAWLVEHPPLYTLGTSAKEGDVLPVPSSGVSSSEASAFLLPLREEDRRRGPSSAFRQRQAPSPQPSPARGEGVSAAMFPTYPTGRGGQVTYHGPGQRVAYVMRDLKKHVPAGAPGPDLRAYVKDLERWVILTLAAFGIEGFIRDGRVGVWVNAPGGEAKIAALGVRVQKWVTSHGISLNVNPDLGHYAGIVPCGIREFGVTSMQALGVAATMSEVDAVLQERFGEVFG